MKSSLRTLVIFISCSVCAFGDLEIYPGYNFEDQNKNLDISDDPLLPIYNSRRAQAELELDQKYFGMPLEAFRNRLTSNWKAMQKEIINNKNALKAKALNAYKHMSMPDIANYHKYTSHDYGHSNSHILGDVRQDSGSDFTFREEDTDDFEDNFQNNYGDQMGRGVENNYERNGENYGTESRFSFVTEDEPTKFAVAPPDPRFYEKNTPEESSFIQRETNQKQINENGDEEEDEDEEVEREREGADKVSFNAADFRKQPSGISEVDVEESTDDEDDSTVKIVAVRPNLSDTDTAGVYIIAVVAGISAAATVGLIAFGIGWYNLQKHVKNAADVEYPAYGITGPNKEISPTGDRRLAQSAQMYHYQHQKQQIIAMERAAGNERHGSVSEADSDEENEEGDYTVYECPGLAPGHSPAGGCLLALSCEYRVMVQNYIIGLNETKLGIIVPPWVIDTMRNTISTRNAELALTEGRLFSTEEALKIGLIDEMVQNKEEALSKAENFFKRFEKVNSSARQMTKTSLRSEIVKTGEMEVKNPLFQDDPTPAQTPAQKNGEEEATQKK